MLSFILADLRRNRVGVAVVLLLIALSTALGVAVTLQERALRLGSARAAAAFDLVIGAAGSETQLVLSSVFLQPAPLPLLPPSVLARLRTDPRVETAIPVGFGDFLGGYPIIGTTREALAALGGVAQGEAFGHLGDAVVGAGVRRDMGSRFHPFHGTVGQAGEVHAEVEYLVVGRMAATGTPWDRAILVPIQSVWDVHAHDHGEAGHAGAAPHEDHDHAEEASHDGHEHADGERAEGEHGHDHGGSEHAERPIDDAALLDARNPGVPAIVVRPRSIADAYNLRQEYRRDTTMAVFPGEVLTRLYGTLGDASRVLGVISMGVQGLVAAAILLVIAVQVLHRRRQIGALRAFGAPRPVVLGIVWLESLLILSCGVLAGFAIGYGAAYALSQRLSEASGVAMPVEFHGSDLWTLVALFGAAALITLLPGLIAYRQSPAQALRA